MNFDRVWPAAQAVAVLMVLGFFLFSLQPLLNPFLLYLALIVLLIPYRRHREHPHILGVTTVLLVIWILYTNGGLLAPFLVGMGLAYLLDPAVDRLEGRGVSRTVAIVALMVPLLAALVLAAVLGLPAVGRQAGELIAEIGPAVERITAWASGLEQRLAQLPWVGEAVASYMRNLDPEEVTTMLQARQSELANRLWAGLLGVGRGLGAVLTLLSYLILTPVITFYLLRDWDGLVTRIDDLVPRPKRDAVAAFFKEYDELLGGFLRGQITVAILMGILTALGLWVWGFPYAFLIGALVTVFSVVPYLGLVLSLLPAVAVAFTAGNVGFALLKVAVVFGVVQGLEGTVISPRIVGDSVGLHPVWILLAIAAGGAVFGFAGLLLAVPVAAGIKLLLGRIREEYKAGPLYLGKAAEG
jgi:predicted PurR-regulated permease PerM